MNDVLKKAEEKKQIDWLTILRGWAVLLVIIFHSTFEYDGTEKVGDFFEIFNKFFSFRMPLFFFISGFLLYYTKIRKNSPYKSILKERVPRILLPYVFITLSVYFFKVIFSSFVKRPIDFSFTGILKIFIYPETNPWNSLWFLNVVLIFFLCYPLIKLSLTNIYTALITFVLAILLHIFIPMDISFLDLTSVGYNFVFFYSGILFSKYDIKKYMKSPWVIIISVLVFLLSNIFGLHKLLHSFSGIIMSIYFSIVCAKFIPSLFSSFRNYYYQIYLLGTFFQAIMLTLFKTTNNIFLLIFYSILSILLGLYMPVLVSKFVKWLNWKPLLKVLGF